MNQPVPQVQRTWGTRHRRRGSIYAAVLGCSLAVMVIGLSALLTLRVERRFSEGTGDFTQARLYAYSAVEDGLFRIYNDPDWRTNYTEGVWKSTSPIGTGTYTLSGEDPFDADLADDESDSLVLIGTGIQGSTRYKLQVTMVPEFDPLSCLDVSLQVGGSLTFNALTGPVTVTGDQIISSNDVIGELVDTGPQADDSTVYPNMEAVNGFSGTLGPGSTTAGIAARDMPNEATVLDYYAREATAIDWFSLPDNGGARELTKIVLSPTSNPYGATNPDGVYKIDCQGLQLVISECRIVGTLILINPLWTTLITGSTNWEPAIPNYPALVVGGSIHIWQGSDPLDEVANAVNFNPPGTPYLGSADSAIDDQYPSRISGLVYASGEVTRETETGVLSINGVLIVGGPMNIRYMAGEGNALDLTYDQKYHDNPPPGFTTPVQMVISPGTWRQIVD